MLAWHFPGAYNQPMNLKKNAAIFTGRAIQKTVHSLKIGGGSAAPGLYALKIYPDLIADLTKNIPVSVIVTGTNGKTTTSKIISHFAQRQGLRVLKNSTGSNLERGIASALISNSRIGSGKLKKFDLAIWELDEAAFNRVAPQINPQVVIFLNVFRDQLDRYGEVDSITSKWQQTLSKLNKNTLVILNGDDYNLTQLQQSFKGKIQTFGTEDHKILGEKTIGKTKKQILDCQAREIKMQSLEEISFCLSKNKLTANIKLPLPGIYNIYNFLAAFSCLSSLNLSEKSALSDLKHFKPAFGRVEKITLACSTATPCEGYIFLIKNPAGTTQVLQTLSPQLKKGDRLLLALNDNLADGTDVSWIWDVNFEELQNSSRAQSRDPDIYVSGTRAEDLALRLKYAGIEAKGIIIEKNLKKAFAEAQMGLDGRLFILPTYTNMLELQKILTKEGIKQHYWEEE